MIKVSVWKDAYGKERPTAPFPIQLTEEGGQSWVLGFEEAGRLIIELRELLDKIVDRI